MQVAQGVIGVEYWTGVSADPSEMRAALEDVFGEQGSGPYAIQDLLVEPRLCADHFSQYL